jgi:hypothetical protein
MRVVDSRHGDGVVAAGDVLAELLPLLCRMSSWQSSRLWPVCSMQTRTGASVSDG